VGFLETLTVRIEGESSGLERELDRVVGQIEELGSRLSTVGSQTGALDRLRDGVTQAISPAERLGRQLDEVATKLVGIGRIPVTINANAALATLASLNAGIDATMTRLQTVGGGQGATGSLPGMGSGPSPQAGIASGAAAIPRLASGGTVRGPGGWDRVPAWLTAGEFVVSRPAVEAVGIDFLDALNRTSASGGGGPQSGLPDSMGGRSEGRRAKEPGGETDRVVVTVNEPKAIDPTNRVTGREETGVESWLRNEPVRTASSTGWPRGPEESESGRGIVHNYGGVTIQVKETVELGRVMGELRRQGVGARLRRGS